MGVLAMSRAIGDHGLRPYVIAEPEVWAHMSVGGEGASMARGNSCDDSLPTRTYNLVSTPSAGHGRRAPRGR
eukprot:100393-Chlamydomonas_euryale.AAC.3